MKKEISILLIVILVLLPFVLLSQEEEKIVPLYKNDKAPFDGLLVPEDRFTEFLKAEADRDLLEKQLEFKDFEVKLEQDFCQKKVDVCLKDLQECRDVAKRKWYENPSLNRWLGIGIGVVITSLAVYSAGQLDGE